MSKDSRDVPAPPWRKSRRPAQVKRQQLSQELIVETGLRILDAEGFDALSMRRVAQELDTGPASLYAHVSGKEELLELIYDRVLSEVRLPEPDPARWKEQLREYAVEVHRVFRDHADVARAALANIPTEASLAMDRLTLYLVGDAYEGSLHWARMRAAGMSGPEEYFQAFVAQIIAYYEGLPRERFPHLSKHVKDLTAGDGEDRFTYGLELLLDGIEARMPKA
jgi:AcrR family transcriptional regulator